MIEDQPEFSAQRRNLLVVSGILLIAYVADVSLKDFELLGLRPNSESAGEVILFVVCMYSLIRFAQVTDEKVLAHFDDYFKEARTQVIRYLGQRYVKSVVRRALRAKAKEQHALIVYDLVRCRYKNWSLGATSTTTGHQSPDEHNYIFQTECIYTGLATWRRWKLYDYLYEAGESTYPVSSKDLVQQSRIKLLTRLYANLRYPPATEVVVPVILGLVAGAIYAGRSAAIAIIHFAQ